MVCDYISSSRPIPEIANRHCWFIVRLPLLRCTNLELLALRLPFTSSSIIQLADYLAHIESSVLGRLFIKFCKYSGLTTDPQTSDWEKLDVALQTNGYNALKDVGIGCFTADPKHVTDGIWNAFVKLVASATDAWTRELKVLLPRTYERGVLCYYWAKNKYRAVP